MRLALTLTGALLAGCYKPSAEDACRVLCPTGACPSGASCMAGRCVPAGGTCPEPVDDANQDDAFVPIDAFQSSDAALDAFGTTTCTPIINSVQATYGSGSSFTMSRSRKRAAMLTLDAGSTMDVVSVADSANVDTTGTQFVERIRPFGAFTALAAPRMTPDGNTIMMQARGSGGELYLVVSNIDLNGQWSSPTLVQLQHANGVPYGTFLSLVQGTVTETSPRRMPVWLGANGFTEFEEAGQNLWKEHAAIDAMQLGDLVLMRDPSFTPDGLRIVFVGQAVSDVVAIYTATRASLNNQFNTAIKLFDDGVSSEASPFLAAECDKLFYDNTTANAVLLAR